MSSQDSDEEGFCPCNPDTNIPSVSYFRKRSCFKTDVADDGWIKIGKVKELFIYPVEYGTGFKEAKVKCTRNGPEFDTHNDRLSNIKDRRLVVHKRDEPRRKKGEAQDLKVYLSPITNSITCTKNEFYNGEANEFERGNIDGKRVFKRMYEDLAEVELVRRPGDDEEVRLQKLIQDINADLRLGYFTARERQGLIDRFRFTKENGIIEGMLPNYSHFTLVNTKSVDYLKARFKIHMKKNFPHGNENTNEISSKNFFPHIVMEGDPCSHFQEDSVKFVKIGNVTFGDILPCVQNENVIYNHINRNKEFSRLRIYLEKHRQLKNIFNELDHESERAVFGINMEKISNDTNIPEDNRICEDDIVYVKY